MFSLKFPGHIKVYSAVHLIAETTREYVYLWAQRLSFKCLLILAQITFLMCYPTQGFPDDTIEREGKLKAAVIYYLAKFVKWPPGTFSDEISPVVICSLGENNLSKFLTSTMKGKNVRGRPLVVKTYSSQEEVSESDIKGCNMTYFAQQKFIESHIIPFGSNILTVSDDADITKKGGVVYLFEENNRIRIKINLKNAANSRLKISSELLNIAIVEGN